MTFEYPSFNGKFFFDKEIYYFIAGGMCSQISSIEFVSIGRNISDVSPVSMGRAEEIFSCFTNIEKRIYLVKDLTKQQIVDFLPGDLTKLTWSCRTPKYKGLSPIMCGECKACRELKNIKYKVE
jgi:7-cyano-7-deazaguanine synthase in queuosine biosynthesis